MINFNSLYANKRWLFGAGHIPLHSTGNEPAFTSHDRISILNSSNDDADILLKIFYENQEPVSEYRLEVKARRVRKIRFNDLIDPLPVSLETAYGFSIHSNIRVVVQFTRMDTSSRNVASFLVTPYHLKS